MQFCAQSNHDNGCPHDDFRHQDFNEEIHLHLHFLPNYDKGDLPDQFDLNYLALFSINQFDLYLQEN